MKRHTITLGAATTAGGKVISASDAGSIHGSAIAMEGDLISCPACKTEGRILCVGPRLAELWNDKSAALERDLCLCGCDPAPRLIANQSIRWQNIDEPDNPGAPLLEAEGSIPLTSSMNSSVHDDYDLDFTVCEEQSGLPLIDWNYTIELSSGKYLKGKTNHSGKTDKISGVYADRAILRIYAPSALPINPNWDR